MYRNLNRLFFLLTFIVLFFKPSFCMGQDVKKNVLQVGDVFKTLVMPDKACIWQAVEIETDSLTKGINNIQIQGLPTDLNVDSFQVSVGPSFRSFISVEAVDAFLYTGEKIVSLEKEQKLLFAEKAKIEKDIEICNFKLSFLKRTSVDIDSLDKLNKSIESVVAELEKQQVLLESLQQEHNITKNKINSLQDRIDAFLRNGEEIRLDIKLFVEKIPAEKDGLIISYWVNNAGYFISYNVKILPESNQVEIISALNVWQKSNLDWNDIQLSIALTSNASSGRDFVDKTDTLISGSTPNQYFFDNCIYDAILRYDKDLNWPGQLILRAQIKNEKAYKFAKGPAKVFFGGNYAGKTVFGPCDAGGQAEISFLYQDCDTVVNKNTTNKKDSW